VAEILNVRTVLHGHMCCGVGGGADGFNRGSARVGNTVARFECVGGIDNDPGAVRDFSRRAGVAGTVLDLFSREQYIAFHGREPPIGWRDATPADIRAAFNHRRPHIVFMSPPCKGFSGLLAETTSRGPKYQALNQLALRCVWLLLEAYADDPVELILMENVPRMAVRGRALLDRIAALYRHFGYGAAETKHDCGEIGNLAQSRKRFLMVARHLEKVPAFLYEPPKRRLRGVGEVLDRLPLPGDIAAAGPMHRVPSLQWRTWVRLAFVEAGSDWRSLNRLRIADGQLADYGIAPDTDWRRGPYGVNAWDRPMGVVAGRTGPSNGAFNVADPRPDFGHAFGQLGVGGWDQSASTLINIKSPGQGRYAVADPRASAGRHVNGKYRIVAYDEPSNAVIAASTTGNGAFALADPRCTWGHGSHRNKLKVVAYDGQAATVTGADRVGSGACSVADPRPRFVGDGGRAAFQSGGHYGVTPWADPSNAVPGFAKNNNGPWNVADPRLDHEPANDAGATAPALPAPDDRLVCVIRALDDTWHRPFTTLELAALQSLIDPDELDPTFTFDGAADSRWREGIGNAVPPDAAKAMADSFGQTLLMAWAGETFTLNSQPIWVRPFAVAASIDMPQQPEDLAHG